jgi:hypothetical protein
MDFVSVPVPTKLYNQLVLRTGGNLDVTRLIIDVVDNFIESSGRDLESLIDPKPAHRPGFQKFGDPERSHEWGSLALPNGTELRMRYKQQTHYSRVVNEQIEWEGQQYGSVSQWVRTVAENTSRNAWHDVWIKRPTDREFIYSDSLRRV